MWQSVATTNDHQPPVDIDVILKTVKEFDESRTKALKESLVGIPVFRADSFDFPISENGYAMIVGKKLWDKLQRLDDAKR
jgi:hypothetical protein